jgi:hypothetical protein
MAIPALTYSSETWTLTTKGKAKDRKSRNEIS